MYMFLLSFTIYVVQLYPKVNEEKVVKKRGGGRKKTTQGKEMKEKRGEEKMKNAKRKIFLLLRLS